MGGGRFRVSAAFSRTGAANHSHYGSCAPPFFANEQYSLLMAGTPGFSVLFDCALMCANPRMFLIENDSL